MSRRSDARPRAVGPRRPGATGPVARTILLPLLLLCLLATTGCGNGGDLRGTGTPAAPAAGDTDTLGTAGPLPGDPSPQQIRAQMASDPYVGVADLLHSRGVRIWWESDLVARWLDGPAAFATAVDRLGVLARQPGTVGFKVADELGYHDDLTSPKVVLRFLRDVRRALGRVAPGKEVLVDAVVLELGCLPRAEEAEPCAARARAASPASSIDAVTSYLRAGLIDRLDLSTGLGTATQYPDHDLAKAQDVAWAYVQSGSWPTLTHLQSRKALAQAGGYAGNPTSDLRVFVEVPHEHKALATDIWTWRQRYQGKSFSLFGDRPTHNPLWAPLMAQRARGVRLFTHMTPSTLPTAPRALARECNLAARIFSDVFVAAGTG